jgi:PIN domain nuclease of toxin-antitoxin system
VRLLLDTHAFIWAARDPARLSARAAAAIEDADNDVFVSAVSAWEIAIKRARGRLRFPDVDEPMLAALRIVELPIRLRHAAAIGTLPDHHRDPFDRMLLAQARADDLTIVSHDRAFTDYDAPVLW